MAKKFNLEEFKIMIPDESLGSTDYLHAIFKSMDLPVDILICFSKLFWPPFSIIEDSIFLSESFNLEKYNESIKEGVNIREVQFWSNLTEITGIFENIDLVSAEKVAVIISNIWNQKIKTEYKNMNGKARVIIEKDHDEVFLTIDVLKDKNKT